MRISFATVDGIKTRYVHAGEGHPVFLLHGVGMSGDSFIRNLDVLGQDFHAIAPDMLGHGFIDAVDFQGGPPQLPTVKHLGRLADHLGFDKYSVAGSSYGGLIAALMALDRPAQVENLIIIGSGSVFHPADDQVTTLKAVFANASQAMGDPTYESCRQRMANICFDPKAVDERVLISQLTSYADPTRFDAYKATINGMIDAADSNVHRVHKRLEDIKTRTLILTGREDIRAKIKLHEEGRHRIPNARIVVFEKCSHMPMMEYPERFNATLKDFLQGKTVGD